MATPLHIAPAVREQLRAALVEDASLLESLRGARGERLPGPEGMFLYHLSLPAPRPLDPEFVQMLAVEAVLRPQGEGWEVVELRGLRPDS